MFDQHVVTVRIDQYGICEFVRIKELGQESRTIEKHAGGDKTPTRIDPAARDRSEMGRIGGSRTQKQLRAVVGGDDAAA